MESLCACGCRERLDYYGGPEAKYASNACRQRAYRVRKAAQSAKACGSAEVSAEAVVGLATLVELLQCSAAAMRRHRRDLRPEKWPVGFLDYGEDLRLPKLTLEHLEEILNVLQVKKP